MQKLFRIIRRWWITQNIRQRNEYIRQYREAIARLEGSPGEQLGEIARLRTENDRDQKLLETL